MQNKRGRASRRLLLTLALLAACLAVLAYIGCLLAAVILPVTLVERGSVQRLG